MTEAYREVLDVEEELEVGEQDVYHEPEARPRDRTHSAPPQSYAAPQRRSAVVRERSRVRPGEVVAGKYRVERRIADSGLATLLQVRHLVLDEEATLKYLRSEALAFPGAIAEFLRQARILSQVRGEHVARVLDVGMLEVGTPYMVTERPEGPTLSQVIQVRGALPLEEALRYGLQLCEGLASAADRGLFHGSLNPQNIIVSRGPLAEPVLCISDFGNSVSELLDLGALGPGTLATSGAAASLRYLAPEHARDPQSVGAPADVWALGAILHELVSGVPLYQAKTTPALLACVVADPPTPLSSLRSGLPSGLEALVLRCVAKQPKLRFEDARAVGRALESLLAQLAPVHRSHSTQVGLGPALPLLEALAAEPQAAPQAPPAASAAPAFTQTPTIPPPLPTPPAKGKDSRVAAQVRPVEPRTTAASPASMAPPASASSARGPDWVSRGLALGAIAALAGVFFFGTRTLQAPAESPPPTVRADENAERAASAAAIADRLAALEAAEAAARAAAAPATATAPPATEAPQATNPPAAPVAPGPVPQPKPRAAAKPEAGGPIPAPPSNNTDSAAPPAPSPATTVAAKSTPDKGAATVSAAPSKPAAKANPSTRSAGAKASDDLFNEEWWQ